MIVWHELFTLDVEAAKAFYTALLGGEIESASAGGADYEMLRKDGRPHFGFVHNPSGGQIPSQWYPYIHSDDVAADTERATAAGAQLIHGPQEIPDMLTFAVLGDPQHATFGLMTSDGEPQQGVFVWDELHAVDVEAAKRFYGDLAGWKASPFLEGYEMFSAGETSFAGVMENRSGAPGASWLPYLATDDVDGSVTRAMELGAGVVIPTESMERVGRYAVLTDPTGAPFGLHQSTS